MSLRSLLPRASVSLGARLAIACALAFPHTAPLIAQEPTRIESLATQARILARLIEHELAPSHPVVYPDSLVYRSFSRDAAPSGSDRAPAPREDPNAADRVVGEEPPRPNEPRVITFDDITSLDVGSYPLVSARQLRGIRSTAIPGSGALLWVEVDLPAQRSRPEKSAAPGDPARSAWERARRELTGEADQPSAEASQEPAPKIGPDPASEAALVRRLEELVLAHAARLDALAPGEAITIVLSLRTPTSLDRLLADRSSTAANLFYSRLLRTNADGTPSPDAKGPKVPEIVRVLRCPRVSPSDGAPRQLETLARYEQR